MKKIVLICIMALMLCMTVFATTPGAALKYVQAQQQEQVTVQKQLMETNVKGLENAQLRVTSQEQKQKLEQIMQKIQLNERERLGQLEDVIIDVNDEIELEGKKTQYLFRLFPVKRSLKYTISPEGEVARKTIGLDFLYADSSIFVKTNGGE